MFAWFAGMHRPCTILRVYRVYYFFVCCEVFFFSLFVLRRIPDFALFYVDLQKFKETLFFFMPWDVRDTKRDVGTDKHINTECYFYAPKIARSRTKKNDWVYFWMSPSGSALSTLCVCCTKKKTGTGKKERYHWRRGRQVTTSDVGQIPSLTLLWSSSSTKIANAMCLYDVEEQ